MVQLNVLAIADMLVIPTTPAKLDADHVMNMIDEAEAMRRDLRLPSLITPGRVVVSITRRSTNAGIETTVLELLKERKASDIVVFGGGIIPPDDARAFRATLLPDGECLRQLGDHRRRQLSAVQRLRRRDHRRYRSSSLQVEERGQPHARCFQRFGLLGKTKANQMRAIGRVGGTDSYGESKSQCG